MAHTLSPGMPASSAAGLRVLVIDDQPALRSGLSALLRAALGPRATVCTAADAREATLMQGTAPADLVLLDVDLAGDDGLRLLPSLRRDSRVLVLTCHDNAPTRERAFALGANAFVGKAEPADLLLAEVHRLGAHGAHHAGHDKAPTAVGSAARSGGG